MSCKEDINVNKDNLNVSATKPMNKDFLVMTIIVYIGFICVFWVFAYTNHNISVKEAKTMKEHKQIIKKVNIILGQKTRYKTSMSYLFGVYSKNSISKDKTMIKCYNKFHSIKLTAQCVRGVM